MTVYRPIGKLYGFRFFYNLYYYYTRLNKIWREITMKKLLIILTMGLFVLSAGITVGATPNLENNENGSVGIFGGPPFGNIPTED